MRRLASYTEKNVRSNDGLSLYYEIKGEGKPALIFIHGLGGDVAAWDEERVYLNKMGYRTIAMDLRGHGFSDHPSKPEGYSLEHFARDIKAIIDQERIDSFILVGHCFGGMVVYTFDDLFPGEAKGLILIDTSYRAPYLSHKSLLRHLILRIVPFIASLSPGMHVPRHVDYTQKGFEHDFEPFGLYGVIKHNSLKTFLSVTQVVLSLNVFEKLQKIRVPTLIIAGTKDTIYPLKMSEEIHKRIKDSEMVVVKGANHPIVLNNPMEVSVVMHRFITNLSGKA